MSDNAIVSGLARLRRERGLGAAQLAALVGASRQTIYSIEAGTYVPNTLVALKLARALQTSVEELFSLPGEEGPPGGAAEPVRLLPGADPPEPGQPLQLCRIDDRMVAAAPSPVPWFLPASDAVSTGKAKARIFHPQDDFSRRILVAGCDPGISVLARHALAAGVELVLVHRNSSQALALLKKGAVHVAGTHLGENIPAVNRLVHRQPVAVVSLAVWEQGLVTARGNPKKIQGIEDLARADVSFINREAGAGARYLLDLGLKRLGIGAPQIPGYNRTARGHLEAALQVQTGAADCCIATGAAARLFGLAFIPLASERYDFVVHEKHLNRPEIQTVFDTLSRIRFRRELEALGGYDTGPAGDRVL